MPAGMDIEVHTPASQPSQSWAASTETRLSARSLLRARRRIQVFTPQENRAIEFPVMSAGEPYAADRFGASLWALFHGFGYPAIDEQILLSGPSWVSNIA